MRQLFSDRFAPQRMVLNRSDFAAMGIVQVLSLLGSLGVFLWNTGFVRWIGAGLGVLSLISAYYIITLVHTAMDHSETQLTELRRQLRTAVDNSTELPMEMQTALAHGAWGHRGIMTYAGSQRDVALNAMVSRILEGNFSSLQQINQALSTFDLEIHGTYYGLALFHTLEIPDDAFDLDLENTLRIFGYPNPLAAFFRTIIGDLFASRFTCMVCEANGIFKCIVTSDDSPEELHAKMLEISDRIVRLFAQCFSITMLGAISQVRQDYGSLRESNGELLQLMDCRSFMGDTRAVISCEDLDIQSAQCYQLGVQKNRELVHALETRRFDTARKLCNITLRECQEASEGNYLFTRFRLSDMAYTCLFSNVHLPQQETQQLYQALQKAGSIQDYDAFFELLISSLERTSSGESSSWTQRMAAYIDQHYTEQDLSVSTVSAQFHYNPIYATKIFKQEMGQNISDYIQARRLERSRELLGRGYTVREIADACGFSSAAAMNRIYSKVYGVTPGKMNGK
jgi:AraC-like DNA-binding protein